MGQKVHPYGIRLGIVKNWKSTWYSKNNYAETLHGDFRVRKYLRSQLADASVSSIEIERLVDLVRITINSGRPGVIIGKKGGGIEMLRTEVAKLLKSPVNINIKEIRKPELDAHLVAASVAQQLEHRVMFRRAMKRAVSSALRSGAQGIKICVSGRLGGAEIARDETYREGRVPLHTFRADIDYGQGTAKTTYGMIGVKVWIFKGEVSAQEQRREEEVRE